MAELNVKCNHNFNTDDSKGHSFITKETQLSDGRKAKIGYNCKECGMFVYHKDIDYDKQKEVGNVAIVLECVF